MKGQFKSIRNLIERAYSEHSFGVSDRDVRVVDSLTKQDFEEIQKTGNLSSDRFSELLESKETVCHTISLISNCFKALSQSLSDLSKEDLEKRGMKITKINDGMSVIEYDEYF